MISLTLNGKKINYSGKKDLKLINWIRDIQKIKSVKDGCSGQGVCGACLVEIDGRAKLACSVSMEKLQSANILTLDGFPTKIKLALGKAFVAAGAVQCGFCSSGMLSRAKILLDKNPNPSREDITKAIKPNLCRCTGYVKIIDAILLAAKTIRENKDISFEKHSIGSSAPKYQGVKKALGTSEFTDDIEFDGMLHSALCFTEHPRAKILSINTAAAESMSGVVKILTAKDVPGKRYLGVIVKDWPIYIAQGETTRYIGDVLACVVAESEKKAQAAVKSIKVTYKVYEPITDPKKSIESNIKIHPGGNILKESNICYGKNIRQVFETSEYVVSETFQTQRVEHAFLETETGVATYENDIITVYSQSQGIYEDRHQLAEMLNIEEKKVNIKLIAAGGAFGGKEDLTVQGHAALATYHLKKPVKVKLNRFESIKMHPKRHPMQMEYKLSADKEGKFTGLYARIIGDTGAYASMGGPVTERAATHAGGAYYIPNIDVKSMAVYTNNPVCGAMRGFGVNQVTFAIESLIDQLCEQGGFNRWEIRYKNALDKGLTTTSGHKLRKETGLKKALLTLKEEYKKSESAGIACAIKNCGLGNGIPEISRVKIKISENEKISILHGWSEMGQGIDTVLIQMLCQHLQLKDTSKIEVIVATENETTGGSTTASRGTFLAGKALLLAGDKLKKEMKKNTIKKLAGKTYTGEYICDWTTPADFDGEVISHFAYSFAVQMAILTKQGKIKKIKAIHDSGKVVNKKLFEGQIEGGIAMGLGYALTESLPTDKGKIINDKFGRLGLLRASDIPEIEVISTEIYDIDAPFGAKGVGEIACIPTAPAVASAYRKFDGKKRTKLPLTPITKKL
ncbi:MAG: selenium-dependent xanthine dehydrogenase [Deltaproteobacteria bacterium]|nr:selenium-dependent xanthine dehydrogenase [Deltaproteobacteria bacterium]